MSGYSVKKAGVGFKVKVETNADLTGAGSGFTAYYINDSDGVKTDIVGSFTEDVNTAGLYFSPNIVIPNAGDYTFVVGNPTAGMDNHPTPLVVTIANIDDVKLVVDALAVTLADDGVKIDDIITKVDAVKAVVDANEATLENAGYGLSALKDLLDSVTTAIGTSDTDIKAILQDATTGLGAIKADIMTRFDALDLAVATIDSKVTSVAGAQGFNAFI